MDFGSRHIGPDHADRSVMLKSLGYPDLESFIQAVVPAGIANTEAMGIPTAAGESQALDELQSRMTAMELPTSLARSSTFNLSPDATRYCLPPVLMTAYMLYPL